MTADPLDNSYPGERLGMPAVGSGSVARPGRRIAALAIDWAAAVLISIAFFAYDSFATLVVFAAVGLAPVRRLLRTPPAATLRVE